MKNHYIIKMSRKIIAALLTLFYKFYGDAKLCQLARQIITCLSAAYNHGFLQISIFAFFVNFLMKLYDFSFFPYEIESIMFVDYGFAVWYDNLAVS